MEIGDTCVWYVRPHFSNPGAQFVKLAEFTPTIVL